MAAESEPHLAFAFRYGWCSLTLRSPGAPPDAVTVKATTIIDSFRALTRAFADVAEGANCASVAWVGEGSGSFIDIATAVHSTLGIVVHEMADPEYIAADSSWLPVRGRVLAAFGYPATQFWRDLQDELTRVRTEYADEAGHMEHWGWDFPEEHLRRLAVPRS